MSQLKLRLISAICTIAAALPLSHLHAVNCRHLTTYDGLSNMAVLSFMQDSDGYIWAATCDGVNVIANDRITSFGAGNNGRDEFSGNLVETISQDGNGVMWVHTNYGLDRYDANSNSIKYFRHINSSYKDALSPSGDVAVITNADSLLFYTAGGERFHNLGLSAVRLKDAKAMHLADNNTLTIASSDGVVASTVNANTTKAHFRTLLSVPIRHANISHDIIYIVSQNMELWTYNLNSGKSTRIMNLPREVIDRGDIAGIVADGTEYVIGFKANGAVRLIRSDGEYTVLPLDIDCGVFAVYKDERQDILWIGTDGDGIYYYTRQPYRFYAQTRGVNGNRISKPVRAIITDPDGNLWAGTKGDGLLCFHHFSTAGKNTDVSRYTQSNSSLNHNDIYALAPSSRPLFWIGSQGHGLCYYSFIDKNIHRLDIPMMPRLQSVHALYEAGNGDLYVATLGEGVFRLSIGGNADNPVVTDACEVIYDGSSPDSNAFFSITAQNDDILWFGNRGLGAYRYDRRDGSYSLFDLSQNTGPVANDVFGIFSPGCDNDTVYCATSLGLIGIARSAGHDSGLLHMPEVSSGKAARSAHAILRGSDDDMLVSTNFGIVRYEFHGLKSTVYASGTDFDVTQFSDGAAYSDPKSGVMYFGAANGILAIIPTNETEAGYMPPVLFRNIIIGNERSPLAPYLNDEGRLSLPYDENNFSLTYAALDYHHGAHYLYRSRLKGANDEWVNSSTGTISFANLSPGKYVLEVCYHNGSEWSSPYSMPIEIRPPFYASAAAYGIYTLLLIGLIIGMLAATVRFQHNKRDALMKSMAQKNKEDTYEAKLKFFTNITHELFTPLTLINGSCERMLSDSDLSQQNKKLTTAIHKNSTRLTELIQELIEFRRIDTEYRKPEVEMLDVSDILSDITDNFGILAERKSIILTTDIESGINWPSDRSGFITIVNNLVSNALKYTPKDGEIKVSIHEDKDNDLLTLTVSNTGEGIAPENISQIFDRYKVLERFERLSAAGTIKRNGLGLAVCDGLVKILSGTINVESRQGELTTFTVTLPRIDVTRTEASIDITHYQKDIPQLIDESDEIAVPPSNIEEGQEKRPILYVVDDDKDMLWFIADSFRNTFCVRTFSNADAAAEALGKEWPSVIICDVIMEGTSGIEFVRSVKSDKSTAHIPVVQLSSLHSEEDKIKSLEAGADIYVTKPFKVEYLRTVIDRLMKRKENLKEFFDSSISAFNKVDGQVIHSDDRDFFNRVTAIIEENITNPELSTKFIAETLGVSVRNLYRRLEGFTKQTPMVIIKEMRLNMAKNMLAHTTLSIDEILYKSGFNNRGTFFKLFQQKYECTPKQYRKNLLDSAKSDLGID